jgi:hypothetical protein
MKFKLTILFIIVSVKVVFSYNILFLSFEYSNSEAIGCCYENNFQQSFSGLDENSNGHNYELNTVLNNNEQANYEKNEYLKYLYFAIIIFTIIIILQTYLLIKSKKLNNRLMLENDYLTYKKESMIYHVNPHFIFNILNSIQFNIKNNDYEITNIYITKFSQYLRMVLEHYQQDYISFLAEIESVKLYLELEQLRLRNKFTFKIQKFNDFNLDKYQIPPLILQPYVENAIWLGFFEKQTTQEHWTIIINLKEEKNILYCEQLDNGLNFEELNIYNQEKSVKNTLTAQKRIEIYNKLFKSNIELKIEPYKKEPEFKTGTRVLLKIPAFISK